MSEHVGGKLKMLKVPFCPSNTLMFFPVSSLHRLWLLMTFWLGHPYAAANATGTGQLAIVWATNLDQLRRWLLCSSPKFRGESGCPVHGRRSCATAVLSRWASFAVILTTDVSIMPRRRYATDQTAVTVGIVAGIESMLSPCGDNSGRP